MKKIFAALLSASFLLSPIVASEAKCGRSPPSAGRRPQEGRRREKGRPSASLVQGLSHCRAAERGRYGEVRDYRRYRLAPPPRGYHWVRADNDYLLVGVATSVITSIIAANR